MDGNLLKEARLEKHWTQEQAALALDVTQAYLSMMEKGHRPLSERFQRGTGGARLSGIFLSSRQETTEPRGGLTGGTERTKP
jgi:transcriptional regulator with XRE-family HTH domain